jgi:hypothetical protein
LFAEQINRAAATLEHIVQRRIPQQASDRPAGIRGGKFGRLFIGPSHSL